MNIPIQTRKHPVDAAFAGPDVPASPVTYASIVEQIRAMDPRALTTDKQADAATLIAFMHKRAIEIHDANERNTERLTKWEKDLTRREAELVTRQRIVEAATGMLPRRRWFYFWR